MENTRMSKESLLIDLARVTHELWRLRLDQEGWSQGPYEPARHTHDALVPFEQLSRGDRLALQTHIEDERLAEVLTDSLDYPRGPDRPFLLEEMAVGMPVAFRERECPQRLDQVRGDLRGRVIRWEIDSRGELGQITVQWNTGEVSDYDPWSRALVRVAELL
jgi:hypothetical protein